MKKLLIYIAIVGFLISCGGDVNTDNGNKPPAQNNGNGNGEKTPCAQQPTADDGETPPALPDC